jgi:hypothetical protein
MWQSLHSPVENAYFRRNELSDNVLGRRSRHVPVVEGDQVFLLTTSDANQAFGSFAKSIGQRNECEILAFLPQPDKMTIRSLYVAELFVGHAFWHGLPYEPATGKNLIERRMPLRNPTHNYN